MSAENINFDDKKIKTSDFSKNKKPFKIDDIDVNKILVSKKESYGIENALKYFIGYNDNDIIRPLCLRLSQMIGYVKKFDENTTATIISLRVSDKKLLKNYNKIWEKVEKLMEINFESKPVYSDDKKYIKIKIYGDFHNKKVPKEKAYKCLSIIMPDSVIKSNKYPQMFLEECKYEQQKKNYIDEDLKSDCNQMMKQNKIVTLMMMMKQSLIFIMMNKFKKIF